MEPFLPTGKLDPALLAECLALCPTAGPGVVLGPGLGEDAAILEPGDGLLLAKADPITFATDRLGWYAVHVATNDIATMGGEPRWLLLTLLLPEGATTRQCVLALFEQVGAACREVGAVLVGGHTEVACGLPRPIASVGLLGVAPRAAVLRTADARVGDAVLLAGVCAIEGTAILARELAEPLRRRGVGEETLRRAAAFLDTPGISVLRAARVARSCAGVHAMHDPTEGGVLCGLWELAAAAGCALRLGPEPMPVAEETRVLCAALGADPLRLIASGALLVACGPGSSEAVRDRLSGAGCPAVEVGRLEPGPPGVVEGATGRRLETGTRDELARLFECAGP